MPVGAIKEQATFDWALTSFIVSSPKKFLEKPHVDDQGTHVTRQLQPDDNDVRRWRIVGPPQWIVDATEQQHLPVDVIANVVRVTLLMVTRVPKARHAQRAKVPFS
jgi:hypothetical protein